MDWLVDDRVRASEKKWIRSVRNEKNDVRKDSLSRPHLLLRWQKCRSEKPLIKRAMSSASLCSQTAPSRLCCAPLALRLPSHYTGGQPLPFLCVCVCPCLKWTGEGFNFMKWTRAPGRDCILEMAEKKWWGCYDVFFSFFLFIFVWS